MIHVRRSGLLTVVLVLASSTLSAELTILPANPTGVLGEAVTLYTVAEPGCITDVVAEVRQMTDGSGRSLLGRADRSIRLLPGKCGSAKAGEAGLVAQQKVDDGFNEWCLDSSMPDGAHKSNGKRPRKATVAVVFRPFKKDRLARSNGNGLISPQIVTVALDQPKGTLDAVHLKQRRYELLRKSPFQPAERDLEVTLIETSGTTDLYDLVIRAEDPHSIGDGGAVTRGTPEVKQPPEKIASGHRAKAVLSLTNFRNVGTSEIDLVVDSPQLSAPAILPIRVTVRDRWQWPLAVIFVGVALAFLVHRFMKKLEATQLIKEGVNEISRGLAPGDAAPPTAEPAARTPGQRLRDIAATARRRNFFSFALRRAGHEQPDLRSLVTAARDNLSKPERPGIDQGDPVAAGAEKVDKGLDTLRTIQGVQPLEVVLAVVGILLATLLGFQTLYFGKAFGTASDYLGALLFGFGAQIGMITVPGLLDWVKRFIV